MGKKIIHFAHANGFPAGTYTRLFALLKPSLEIRFINRHGHDPRYPVTDGWMGLKDELRDAIVKDFTQPVIGVGHSLGGILHLLVCVDNPELYERIILLDAPIISRFSSGGIRVLKTLRLMDRLSSARMTKSRRSLWASKAEALEHFQAKPKFAAFDSEVLNDYIEYGTIQTSEGVRLFFDPRV
ncbi:MAG: alpha/beta hydrolase, partial [Saprospiraceae bacterium]|nr:alpha/beta hydrolase [Pyrinomonadaceae bacterium]